MMQGGSFNTNKLKAIIKENKMRQKRMVLDFQLLQMAAGMNEDCDSSYFYDLFLLRVIDDDVVPISVSTENIRYYFFLRCRSSLYVINYY